MAKRERNRERREEKKEEGRSRVRNRERRRIGMVYMYEERQGKRTREKLREE